jgi:hypothetical protein
MSKELKRLHCNVTYLCVLVRRHWAMKALRYGTNQRLNNQICHQLYSTGRLTMVEHMLPRWAKFSEYIFHSMTKDYDVTIFLDRGNQRIHE